MGSGDTHKIITFYSFKVLTSRLRMNLPALRELFKKRQCRIYLKRERKCGGICRRKQHGIMFPAFYTQKFGVKIFIRKYTVRIGRIQGQSLNNE